MNLIFETQQEDDGRWLAKVPEVMAYGATELDAIAKALALHVLADRKNMQNGRNRIC